MLARRRVQRGFFRTTTRTDSRVIMPAEPRDSFDPVPVDVARRGAHRPPPRRGRGWVTFAWATLATGLLIAIGAAGLFALNNNIQFPDLFANNAASTTPTETPTFTPTPTPTVAPTTDPKLAVTILNGTTTEGLATRAANRAEAAGWTVGVRGNADSTKVATTTVYYLDAVNEGAAKGLALALGGAAIVLSDEFPKAELTAIIGTDYHDSATTSAP